MYSRDSVKKKVKKKKQKHLSYYLNRSKSNQQSYTTYPPCTQLPLVHTINPPPNKNKSHSRGAKAHIFYPKLSSTPSIEHITVVVYLSEIKCREQITESLIHIYPSKCYDNNNNNNNNTEPKRAHIKAVVTVVVHTARKSEEKRGIIIRGWNTMCPGR